MAFNPNSELVAVNFIKSLGLSTSSSFGVGTTFPAAVETIKDGFIQVQVVGGSPNIDVPERHPLIQVDCYIPSINSSKPAWNKAATLAEDLTAFVYEHGESTGRQLDLGTAYKGALVQSCYLANEVRRVTNDPGNHARYTFDLSLTWIVSEPVASNPA